MSLSPEQLPRRSSNIFINYRREDSAGHAGRLFDRLSSRFPDRVFMDVDTIAPGVDFVETIEKAVGCCEILIVMIGRDWLFLTDATGRRRLDNPDDFVRLEIAAALERNVRIIPVLVGDATMPRAEDLPPELAKLTRRNAIELSDVRWAFDVDRLIHTIEGVLQERAPSALMPALKAPSMPAPAEKRARPRTWLVLSAPLLLALPVVLGWGLARQLNPEEAEITLSTGLVAPAKAPQASPEEPAEQKRKPAAPLREKASPREEKSIEAKTTTEEVTQVSKEGGPKEGRGRLGFLQRGKSAFKKLRNRGGSESGQEAGEKQGG